MSRENSSDIQPHWIRNEKCAAGLKRPNWITDETRWFLRFWLQICSVTVSVSNRDSWLRKSAILATWTSSAMASPTYLSHKFWCDAFIYVFKIYCWFGRRGHKKYDTCPSSGPHTKPDSIFVHGLEWGHSRFWPKLSDTTIYMTT